MDTETQLEKLLELRNEILVRGPEKFNMGHWVSYKKSDDGEVNIPGTLEWTPWNMIETYGHCITSACIAGTACIINPEVRNVSAQAVADYYDIPSNVFFTAHWGGIRYEDTTLGHHFYSICERDEKGIVIEDSTSEWRCVLDWLDQEISERKNGY